MIGQNTMLITILKKYHTLKNNNYYMIDIDKFDYIEYVLGYINKCTHSGQNEFVNRIDEHINNLNNCFRGLELSMEIYDKYEILFDKIRVKEVLYCAKNN